MTTPNPSRSVSPEPTKGETFTYVHATSDDRAEDGIWRAIDRRIGYGYSGVSGARELEENEDIRAAIRAVRASEQSAYIPLVEAAEAAKDGAYSERNKTVVALAHMARLAGCRVGVREHDPADVDWDDDWRAILIIDLPTGQASWHFHDSERPMLASFGPYPDEWDGHSTDEKYARLAALVQVPGQQQADTNHG